MPNFDQILNDEHAAKLLRNPSKLEHLRDAPETQRLFSMLSQQTETNLEQAANHAMSGDTAQLISAIQALMKNPESARLIQQIKEKMM